MFKYFTFFSSGYHFVLRTNLVSGEEHLSEII